MDNTYGDGESQEPLDSGTSIQQLLESLAQSERELKQQVRLFSAFLDALPNPIFVKDNDAVFIACNTAYEEAFGIAREAFVGRTVLDLDYLPELSRHAFQQADLKLLRERGETREEIKLAFVDGQTRTVLYQRKTFDLGNGRGGMLGLIVIFLSVNAPKSWNPFAAAYWKCWPEVLNCSRSCWRLCRVSRPSALT